MSGLRLGRGCADVPEQDGGGGCGGEAGRRLQKPAGREAGAGGAVKARALAARAEEARGVPGRAAAGPTCLEGACMRRTLAPAHAGASRLGL